MTLIDSKYPIICAAMNKVSDINLALACHDAGIFPSLSFYNYYLDDKNYDLNVFEKDIKKFLDKTGSSRLLVSMGVEHLKNDSLITILRKNNFKFIELIEGVTSEVLYDINEIKKQNEFYIFVKLIGHQQLPNINGVILKGPDGAGRSLDSKTTLENMFETARKRLDKKVEIILSGGISSSLEIKKYLDLGASAVAIGSLFAATIESPLNTDTKLKLVNSTSANLKRFSEHNSQALIFSRIDNDDDNHTKSLKIGIKNSSLGHIFIGKSIDSIDRIKTVKELVNELVINL